MSASDKLPTLSRLDVPFYFSDDAEGLKKVMDSLGGRDKVARAVGQNKLGQLVCTLRPDDPQAHPLRPIVDKGPNKHALVIKVTRKGGKITRANVLGTLPKGHVSFQSLSDFQFLHASTTSADSRADESAAAARTDSESPVFDLLPLSFTEVLKCSVPGHTAEDAAATRWAEPSTSSVGRSLPGGPVFWSPPLTQDSVSPSSGHAADGSDGTTFAPSPSKRPIATVTVVAKRNRRSGEEEDGPVAVTPVDMEAKVKFLRDIERWRCVRGVNLCSLCCVVSCCHRASYISRWRRSTRTTCCNRHVYIGYLLSCK